MGVLVLTAGAGAPGVTTAAVGLALTWPRSVLLVDADPAAGHAVLAGFLRGHSAEGKGLVRVAEAHRDHRNLREAVLDQSLDLIEDPTYRRRLLPGFSRPTNAALFAPAWPEVVDVLHRLDEVEIDVVVDAGRIEARGIPLAWYERGSTVVLVTRTSLRAVAAARPAAAVLVEQATVATAQPPGMLLINPGSPYGSREIAAALDLPVLGELPADPRAAAVLSDGERSDARFGRSPLIRALHHVAEQLSERLHRSTAQVGGAR